MASQLAIKAQAITEGLGLTFDSHMPIVEWHQMILTEIVARLVRLENQQQILLSAIEALTAAEMRRMGESNNGGLIVS